MTHDELHPDRHGLVLAVPPYGAPALHETVWLAPGTAVVGDVTMGEQSSLWYNAVLRGDSNSITIGARTNLQDNVVVHTQSSHPTIIDDDVSVGHGAIIHAAHIESGCLIGMNATVLTGATIGAGSLVAAAALVPEGMQVPPGSLVAGVPARVVRELRAGDREAVARNAAVYADYTAAHRAATRAAVNEV